MTKKPMSKKWYHELPSMLEERGLTMKQAAEFCGVGISVLMHWVKSDVSPVVEYGLAAIFNPEWLLGCDISIIIDTKTELCDDCGCNVIRNRVIRPDGIVEDRLKDFGSMWMIKGTKCPKCTRKFFMRAVDAINENLKREVL